MASQPLKAAASSLLDAVDDDQPQWVAELIGRGADPNALHPRTGEPPLFLALERSVKVLDALLAGGADPNLALADDGETAIFAAITFQDQSMVEHLIAGGAKVNVSDKAGNTPLKVAIEMGGEAILRVVKEQSVRETEELAVQSVAPVKSVSPMKAIKFRMGAPR
jgi:uncharacterized protein